MTEQDASLKVALSVHSNPGVYALLLGSGVSRAAGIPTGWEVVLDLIHKVAAAMGEGDPTEPEAWYRQRFDEPADYAKLLDRLTTTPAERMALLRSYFEPTDEEREQGLKLPTPAHRAIASLVKAGHIRMILTTNFDRLMEQALEAEGLIPDVVSSVDALQGAVPYVHSKCVLVKLHGDYRDTRIRNTPDELASYPQELDRFLDRVLDEFGLVICGWSGAWDTALRNAILRCATRRFGTFWVAKSEPGDEARRLIDHRRAQVIRADSADQFFGRLQEQLVSLRELESPHPISAKMAEATVKRYLADPRHRVRLHDLMHEETEHVYHELASARFGVQVTFPSNDDAKREFQQRLRQYQALSERLVRMLAALSYHDEGENSSLLTRCIERLAEPPSGTDGVLLFINLQRYPALLCVYAAGISALASGRFRSLAAVLRDVRCRDPYDGDREPALKHLHPHGVFYYNTGKWVPRRDAEREFTPVSNYLYDVLRPSLRDYAPADTRYDEVFDTFEYLLALTYVDLVGGRWSPFGRFALRYGRRGLVNWERSPLAEFVRDGLGRGAEWELLKAGFFGGSAERLTETVAAYGEWLREVTQTW